MGHFGGDPSIIDFLKWDQSLIWEWVNSITCGGQEIINGT